MKSIVLCTKLVMLLALTFCLGLSATAQDHKIRGYIYDKGDKTSVWGAIVTLEQIKVSGQDGAFEFNKEIIDSLSLSVQQLGYLPFDSRLPNSNQDSIIVYLEPDPDIEKTFIHFGPAYGIKNGYIFYKNGTPVVGASITLTGENKPTRNDVSRKDGSFETRDEDCKYNSGGYKQVNIRVDGHKQFEYTFKSTDQAASLIRHDGLFIVLNFY